MAKNQKTVDPLAGLTFEDARPPRTEIDGYLRRPFKNNTRPVTFTGLLREVVNYKDARKKDQTLYIFESLTDQPQAMRVMKDEESGEEQETPISKGEMIGVNASGAIKVLASKKGYVAILKYTGNKVPTNNGDMWEIDCKVSTTKLVEDGQEVPFA